ncbi:Protein MOS2 [Morus notabilis]|uniref:Protein MOS2 n=1 Tax=Morus notabilis TaxID=981085 RepID=W9RZ88_9ROSA|nr:protein MOS2 [Morus notabilis]EXC18489.1 Protein MOS2 [Morus notabilis]
MSFSFSLPSKSSSKLKPIKPSQNFEDDNDNKSTENDANSRKYVIEFNASETLTGNATQNAVVIPPIQNEWRPHKRMKNLDLPIAAQSDGSGGLQFEVESLSDATNSSMSYGLNLRQTAKGDHDDEINGQDEAKDKNERLRFTPTEDVLLQKLKFDLQRLPEDRGMAEFEDVPVEGFGAALLSGYGWHEGRGIGKNAKEDVKVVEYTKRTGKQGLGFVMTDLPPLPNSNRDSLNNSIPKPKDNNNNNNNNSSSNKESLIGKEVRIVRGRELGLKGRVLEKLSDDNRLVVRLSRSQETVKVNIQDVAELGSEEDEACLKRLKELRIREEEEKKEKKSKRRENKSRDSDGEKQQPPRKSWLRSHIRVRIISRELKGGRLYLKKGEVVDVVGPKVCDVSMDDGRELIQGVSQDVLESALPRRGGPVLVLFGKHEGVYGSLVERDLDRETGVVRDADTHDLINVRLEQIAEYIGDPSYLGY